MNAINIILLILLTITTNVYAQWTLPKNIPPPKLERGVELIAKRTANSKTWINLDKNLVTTEVNSGLLHYKDKDGRWHEIDRNIRLDEDSSRYQVRKGIYHADFGFDLRNRAFLVLLTQYEISDSLEAFVRNQKVSSKSPNNKVRVNFKGKERLEFRNVAGKRKYLMPEDVAFSPDSSSTYPILRHFFNNNNDNFVFEGVLYNWLMAQPPGTIVLDPTVSLNDRTEDTYIANGSAANTGASQDLLVGRQMTNTDWKRMLAKFDLSAIPQDAAILNAALKLR